MSNLKSSIGSDAGIDQIIPKIHTTINVIDYFDFPIGTISPLCLILNDVTYISHPPHVWLIPRRLRRREALNKTGPAWLMVLCFTDNIGAVQQL